MPYVDENYYTNTYKGTLVPTSLFSLYSLKASIKIQTLTQGKCDLKDDNGIVLNTSQNVKLATCSLMDYYYKEDNGIYDVISENVDGYSTTFANQSKNQKTDEEKLFNSIEPYLSGTGLLNSSIGCNYDY